MAEKADSEGPSIAGVAEYRSTPLRPLVVLTIVLVWAFVVALILRVPEWATIVLAALTGTSFVAVLAGWIYLFVADRESLRTGRRWRGAGTPRREGESAELRNAFSSTVPALPPAQPPVAVTAPATSAPIPSSRS